MKKIKLDMFGDSKLKEKIIRSEKQIRNKKFIVANTQMSEEEICELLDG